jgi:hypothetical protein
MKTPSPYSHVYLALAEDKDAKFELKTANGTWFDADQLSVIRYTLNGGYRPDQIRVKPATIRIGSREVPKPIGRGDYLLQIVAEGSPLYSLRWETKKDRDAAADAICALLEGRE